MKEQRWVLFYTLVILTGMAAGVGAIVFRELIGIFHNLFFYGRLSAHYNVLVHAASSPWGIGIILVPVVGALCVACLVQNFAPEAKGHGVPEAMDAIYYERGLIRPVVAVVKALASSICIGSGGSVGREGPIIQIGAAFGSCIGQWLGVSDWQRMTLLACGAGGGIAATFNTPFGGILFALELMLPEISPRTLIPVILGVAISTSVSYLCFGNVTFIPFTTAALSKMSAIGFVAYVVLSVLLALVAWLFIRSVYWLEDGFDRIPGGYYVRHMSGMFFVGLSFYMMLRLTGHYYVQGVGYATVVDVLSQTLQHPGFLLLLALLKLIDTAITLGSGGSGGVFSPLLFIGATFGCAFAVVFLHFFPGHAEINLQLGALAGMAGMVGAATGAPLTAIMMTAELTNDFTIVIPLMIIVSLAYGLRRAIDKDSVYTLKLTRRGHRISDCFYNENQIDTMKNQ